MSYAGSGDEQSEDGELRHSPSDVKKDDILDFSLSDEDADTADSLDIKPPQASRLTHSSSSSSKTKRRERNREGRSRHGRSERHRDQERSHSHREKHHRDRSGRDREQKYERDYREKEHFRERDLYREKEIFMKNDYSKDNFRETREIRYSESTTSSYKESKYGDPQYRNENRREDLKYGHEGTSREVRYVESRKYEEKRAKDQDRYAEKAKFDVRYVQDQEKSRRYEERQERRIKSAADQTLDDLRERLLDKRRIKESSDEYRQYEKESRRKGKEREATETETSITTAMESADTYVKEIIDLSVGEDVIREKRPEKVHRREEKEEKLSDWDAQEKKLSDTEREEQQLRRERLLEAEREIARQKEQYRLDKERRHKRRQERQEAKRRLQLEREEQEQEEEQEQQLRKRQRMSGELGQYKDKDLSIVTVSDNSSNESTEGEEEEEENDEEEDRRSGKHQRADTNGSESELEQSPAVEQESGAETSSRGGSESDEEDRPEGGRLRHRRSSAVSEDEPRDEEKTDSSSASGSRSPSPKSNGQMTQKTDEDGTETKQKSPEVPVNKIDEDLPPYLPAIQGCRSVEEFQCLNRIEEGTYGVVYRARDKRTEEIVALKRLKMEKEKEGFPITSLREINTLLKGQHPNIVTVREIVVGSNMDKIFIVMDYVEHDLKSLMETMRNRRQAFVPGEVKCLLKQLLGAVQHLHDNWILHRDLKTSNLLLSHKGILKVGDFGLAREYGSPLKAYTPIVVTLWYRAPELLLCCKEYSTPVDMWSVGCIFAELLLMNALFPGKSEVDQLNRIFKDLGTPNDKIWPGYSELPAVKKMKFTEYPVSQLRSRFPMLTELGRALLQRLLTYDPGQRVSAEDALQHAYFTEQPLPVDPAMFPTWPAKSELGHRKILAAAQSPKPPSGGREYKQLGDGDEDSALGFHMGGASSNSSHLEARRLASGAGFSLKF